VFKKVVLGLVLGVLLISASGVAAFVHLWGKMEQVSLASELADFQRPSQGYVSLTDLLEADENFAELVQNSPDLLEDIPSFSAGQENIGALQQGSNQTFLLLGSDSRTGDNSVWGSLSGERADVLMLVHVNYTSKWVYVLSIPRDLDVSIPNIEACGSQAGRFTKINAAYAGGGLACSVATVESITQVYIDEAASVDFAGFVRLVDAVGGVPVCLQRPINDPDAHAFLASGPQILNGTDALAFARVRKTITGGSDIARLDRQHYLLSQLRAQVNFNSLLSNPVMLYQVASALTENLTLTDSVSSPSELRNLVSRVGSLSSAPFYTASLSHRSAPSPALLLPFKTGVAPTQGLWDFSDKENLEALLEEYMKTFESEEFGLDSLEGFDISSLDPDQVSSFQAESSSPWGVSVDGTLRPGLQGVVCAS